jgi:hypothetical protein
VEDRKASKYHPHFSYSGICLTELLFAVISDLSEV